MTSENTIRFNNRSNNKNYVCRRKKLSDFRIEDSLERCVLLFV